MIEALKEEEIVNKVGGRFKLSTLIQKRLVALNAGARPLVDAGSDDKMEIIVQEMGREVNMIGSKANDSEISRYVIEIKSALERIREQIQNVE